MAQQDIIGKHKTVVYTEAGVTNVRYHETAVVKFNDKFIELNTGGWFSVTTKTRMNQASRQFDLGYSVYQKNFNWLVDYKDQTFEFNGDRLVLER